MRLTVAYVRFGLAAVGLFLFAAAGLLGLPDVVRAQDQSKRLVNVPPGQSVDAKAVYGASHALLIGVNHYKYLPPRLQLHYAVKDVEDLKDVLTKSYGFPPENVTVLTDEKATLDNIRHALSALANNQSVKPDDRVLVYFSGHGQTVPLPDSGDMGFLIPTDANVDLADTTNAGPYLDTCLQMSDVWSRLDACPAKHVLLMADACYSGLLATPRGAGGLNAASLLVWSGRKARQVITAGGKGESSGESQALGHGVFTFQLLQELKARAQDPGTVFTTTELYSSVFPAVSNQTNGKQKPLMAKFQYEGEFLFITGDGPKIKPPIETVNTMASALITSDPPGASVFVDGGDQPVGTTPYTLVRDLGAKQTLDVSVGLKLDGHQQVVSKVTLRRGPGQQLPGNLLVTLPPLKQEPIHDKPVITVEDPHRPPTKFNPIDGAEMIYIPAGEFPMGDPDRKDNPRHTVTLSGYYLYRDLVTVAQYKAFCKATNRPMPPAPLFDERWSLEDHPMVRVTWEDADAYCKWAGGHLPTEAQWEKAARGASANKYPWGNKWDQKLVTDPVANQKLLDDIARIEKFKHPGYDRPEPPRGRRRPSIFDDTSIEENNAKDLRGTSADGALTAAASPYGALDMVGNVQQWCADWYDKSFWSGPGAATPDAANLDAKGSQTRVKRGASWRDGEGNFRASFRGQAKPTDRAIDVGFRCVLDK